MMFYMLQSHLKQTAGGSFTFYTKLNFLKFVKHGSKYILTISECAVLQANCAGQGQNKKHFVSNFLKKPYPNPLSVTQLPETWTLIAPKLFFDQWAGTG